MILVFLYLLNVQLITRAFWISRDEPFNRSTLISVLSVQLAASSVLCVDWKFAVLVVGTVVANIGLLVLEKDSGNGDMSPAPRVVSMVFWLIFYAALSSDFIGLEFNTSFLTLLLKIQNGATILGLVDGHQLFKFLVVSAGVMLAVWESHVMIRFLFKKLNVKPGTENSEQDSGVINVNAVEYSRGRIIGGLERFLTFFLILSGSYSALGFLIAAKGITRFKQLDDREFAEYFLIGTLLSIILAGSIAWMTRWLLQTQ